MNHRRVVFIDLLRGWAGLVMIEVHVVNAFVLPEIRSAGWFPILNFVNGLVAPSFLFVAGLVFVVVSERKATEFRGYGGGFWKQMGRISLIWVVGYCLHLPFFSLRRTLKETTPEHWLNFYQADVLHCIAAGLLAIFAARVIVKRDEVFERLLWVGAFAAVVMAPFLWDVDFNRSVHPLVSAYVNGQHFSQFPLFPWLGFLFFGGIVGVKFLNARARDREELFIRSIVLWGIGCVAVALLMGDHFRIPGASKDIRPQPVFFLLRLGVVLLLLGGCWWYEQFRKTERSFVLTVSRETLLVYASHLLIIYGTLWNDQSLAALFGQSWPLEQCAAAAAALAVVMIMMAELWGRMKQKSRPVARNLSIAGGLVVLLVFLVQ